MKTRISSGFALLLVLWTLAILSTIALTLAAAVGTEVHAGQEAWNELQAERLAKSGHEMAAYLGTRAVGTANEDLVGLKVEPVIPGLKYRAAFDIGTVDIVFEGENAKFNLTTATEEETARFFTVWTGDAIRGREIAASIADWMDSDDDPRPLGGEAAQYLSRGYAPRNSTLGAADLLLVKGMRSEDFLPSMSESETLGVRRSLTWAISSVPSGNGVNPNYALPIVLRSLPSMTPETLNRILEGRQRSVFTNIQDFRNRVGIAEDSTLLSHLTFSREPAPSILAICRLNSSTVIRTERRTRSQLADRRQGSIPITFISLIEHSASGE